MAKESKTKILWFETFLGFLKDEGIYRNFLYNTLKENKLYNKDKVTLDTSKYAILAAFNWDETEEGFMFWNRMDTKWKNFFTNIDKM